MTPPDTLKLIKLLSALESCLLVSKVHVPDHLWEVFGEQMELLEQDILKDRKQ